MDKDLVRLEGKLRKQGFQVRHTAGNRLVVSREGTPVCTISMRSGDSRAIRNTLARLEKAGFKA